MELKLNIYNGKEITKTYTADTYEIMFGTMEDLIELIDLDGLQSSDNVELLKIAQKVVTSGLGIIKPMLKEVFDGLTDDELRNTRVKDLAIILVEIVKFSIVQISKGATGKM
jgi:hypothetical protein